MSRKFRAADLHARLLPIAQACGLAQRQAAEVLDNLILANLSGHDSHGIGMLPRYVDAVLEGSLRADAKLATRVDIGSLLGFDAQHGFGQILGAQAMQQAIARARDQGCCVMALANAHHLGRIGHWAEMATQAGLVSIHFVNVLARPIVAAWGGADGRYGTNPFCIGIPMGFDHASEPFILDFATSRVAQGKMRVAHNAGQTVAAGLLLDADGQPTQEPGVVVQPDAQGRMGSLLPFGEHKGFGLAVACELLGGALTGGGTWHRPADGKRAVFNSMLSILIDPARLGEASLFAQECQDFLQWLRQSPARDGFDAIVLAGEPERQARLQRGLEGIEVDANTWQEISQAASKLGLPFAE